MNRVLILIGAFKGHNGYVFRSYPWGGAPMYDIAINGHLVEGYRDGEFEEMK